MVDLNEISTFQGPPGCGKTTSIWCLANEMLEDRKDDAVLELNASDDRYICPFLLGMHPLKI